MANKYTTGEYKSVSLDGLTQVQQANIQFLEQALKQHWQLGKHIFLSWCMDEEGIQVLRVPHYFLGKFSTSLNDCAEVDRLDALNGQFIRQLISGSRELPVDDFIGAARRLDLTPTKIELPVPIGLDVNVHRAIDTLIRRYSISYVDSRAVLLFDIVNFSVVSPFEQISQLNSLSYSMNSAYNKLLKKGIEINYSLTTTGDGFYVWHQKVSPQANIDLFYFMLLVIADNAMARRYSAGDGNVVPQLRTGFHIGSHYEFYQTEGENPSMTSYIVGDVTIELARMLELSRAGQIFVGEFDTVVPTSMSESAYLIDANTDNFVKRVSKHLAVLNGIEISDRAIENAHCFLTGESGSSAGNIIRRFRITDKHGRSRNAYNLRVNIHTDSSRPLILGAQDSNLPKQQRFRDPNTLVKTRSETTLRASSKSTILAVDD